jgi:hypothetical protein
MAVAALVGLGAVLAMRTLRSADHRDSPTTMADAAADINDVFAFQSPSNANNVVFALTVSPFITPAAAATTYFDPAVLYQFKIDTNGDAIEDDVIQITFSGTGAGQTFTVRGPATPAVAGVSGQQILAIGTVVTGTISTSATPNVATGGGISAFAGVRDDPFFFDLDQFKKIIAGTATGFTNPGTDTFKGFNTLAIVVEVPRALFSTSSLGVWATTHRL